jgi:hypothetical protein
MELNSNSMPSFCNSASNHPPSSSSCFPVNKEIKQDINLQVSKWDFKKYRPFRLRLLFRKENRKKHYVEQDYTIQVNQC